MRHQAHSPRSCFFGECGCPYLPRNHFIEDDLRRGLWGFIFCLLVQLLGVIDITHVLELTHRGLPGFLVCRRLFLGFFLRLLLLGQLPAGTGTPLPLPGVLVQVYWCLLFRDLVSLLLYELLEVRPHCIAKLLHDGLGEFPETLPDLYEVLKCYLKMRFSFCVCLLVESAGKGF